MNKILKPFRRLLNPDVTSTDLAAFVKSSSQTTGVLFILISGNNNDLNDAFSKIQDTAKIHNARFMEVLSGLFQYLVEDNEESRLEGKCKFLADDIMAKIGKRGVIVWTVQTVRVGSWGGPDFVHYGAMVPNFQEIMGKLSNAIQGEIIAI